MIHRSEEKSGRRITDLLCLAATPLTTKPRHTGPVASGAQIKRTQFVARTGGAYPAVSLGSTNSVSIGRMGISRFNKNLGLIAAASEPFAVYLGFSWQSSSYGTSARNVLE